MLSMPIHPCAPSGETCYVLPVDGSAVHLSLIPVRVSKIRVRSCALIATDSTAIRFFLDSRSRGNDEFRKMPCLCPSFLRNHESTLARPRATLRCKYPSMPCTVAVYLIVSFFRRSLHRHQSSHIPHSAFYLTAASSARAAGARRSYTSRVFVSAVVINSSLLR